jgi:hypothetical protein
MPIIYSFKTQLITGSLLFACSNFMYVKFFNKKEIIVKQYMFGYFLVQYGIKDTYSILVSCILDTLIYIPCAIGLKTIYEKWN